MITDCWKGYSGLKGLFDHRIASNRKSDKEKEENFSISRIEALWSSIKRRLYPYTSLTRKRL